MILGLMGYARSGKDTVGQILVQQHGFVRLAFADALKELAERVDPIVNVEPDWSASPLARVVANAGWEQAKTSLEVRQLLQNLGVGCREVFGYGCWVDVVRRQVDGLPQGSRIVITDVRFPNEGSFIRGYPDGRIWRVDRPGVEAANGHVSEHAWSVIEPDLVIANTASIEALADYIGFVFSRVDW